MTEKTVADTAVAPLVGSLPPHCQRDVDTLRRFVHTADQSRIAGRYRCPRLIFARSC